MIFHFASTEQIIHYLAIEKRISLSFDEEVRFLDKLYKLDEFITLLMIHQIIIERYKINLTQLSFYRIENRGYEKISDGFDFNLDKFNDLETGRSFYLDRNNYSLLTVKEACKHLSIGETKLNELINSRQIPSVKIGEKSVRIQLLDLIDYTSKNKRM